MRPLHCEHCGKKFYQDWDAWELHHKLEHGQLPQMKCKNCDAVMDGITEFDRHLEFQHGKKLASLFLALKETKRKFGGML
jgi:hypothetical protein